MTTSNDKSDDNLEPWLRPDPSRCWTLPPPIPEPKNELIAECDSVAKRNPVAVNCMGSDHNFSPLIFMMFLCLIALSAIAVFTPADVPVLR